MTRSRAKIVEDNVEDSGSYEDEDEEDENTEGQAEEENISVEKDRDIDYDDEIRHMPHGNQGVMMS